jgi:hypothetical protein
VPGVLDLPDRAANRFFAAAGVVEAGEEQARDPSCLLPLERFGLPPAPQRESPSVRRAFQACVLDVTIAELEDPPIGRAHLQGLPAVPPHPHEAAQLRDEGSHPHSGDGAADHHRAHDGRSRDSVEDGPLAPPPELVTVAPGGELRPQRTADPHQLEPLGVAPEPDVFGRDPQTGCAEDPLAVLHRLPALLERGQVPSLAATTHDPEASLGRIEGESATNRKRLENGIRPQ